MPIKFLIARQILDVVGVPTVEVDLVTELGLFRASVPNTSSPKITEAVQLRDNIPGEYSGMGVSLAVKNINSIIAPELIKLNLEITMQREIDQFLISLDGTETRGRLGANAILAVSMVVAKAAAAKKGVPVYRHISDLAGINSSIILPVPHITILAGGNLSTNGLPFKEYMVMPLGAPTFSEAMRMSIDVYLNVKNQLSEKYGVDAVYVADNGALTAPLYSHRDALIFLTDAIRQCGHVGKVEVGLNAAATDIFKDGAYDLNYKDSHSSPQDYLTSSKLGDLYLSNSKEFSVCSVEDPFDMTDWDGWSQFTTRSPIQLLSNALTQTNLRRIGLAVNKKAGNSVTLRLNQLGTVIEIIDAFKIAKHGGKGICITDRVGETDDLFLTDLVIGLSAGQLKCGAPVRGERIGKYNQILRLEEELGALAKYVGRNFRSPVHASKL